MKTRLWLMAGAAVAVAFASGCKPKGAQTAISGDAASKVYVAPGQHDEFYNIVSGGFNGQISVVGLPSGRVLKILPVFSVHPENGWGFSEETKPMLNTTHGFVPWDDLHHIAISTTNAEHDARWAFANANNTPRIARIDLTTFKTVEIIEIPNSSGNHSSPFITENTEYVVAGTRFSIPTGDDTDRDVAIDTYKDNFRGTISFISVDKDHGDMDIAFQIEAPPFNFDLARAGKKKSHGWFFFSTYNTEMAHTLLEVNASQKDKDFIMAVNWKKAEEYIAAGKGKKVPVNYVHNKWDESTHTAISTIRNEVLSLDPKVLKDMVYFIPCPKSPHGTDTDPTGEYIIGSGKLAAIIPVFSFTKMLAAIENQDFEGDINGMPVLKYESVLHGEVEKPGLGPLHTEFDGKGFAYTSMFVSSEIVKWNIETLEVVDRIPTYYSIGHLSIPGGPTGKPHGKYMVAYNKITKDRYLPTGPELAHSAQLYDISGDKMQLLLDFPTIGEPHYAEAFPASLIKDKQVKFYKLEENNHPHALKGINDARVERKGNEVHIYLTSIRSNFRPDNIEGIRVGDEVYFHMTNLEQDWDVPHGLAIKGANTAELLVMPGETSTLKWTPDRVGIFPFYCTDFCSALHQEMQGYIRVSPAGSNTPLKFSTGVAE
ncbi:Sec-dependent nitrous-oxide reductase [Cognataquiflexum rubidum]|uniref:Sec-dependent nitrous-oxide reductase n=1 Tax=Cognataquiflexum rubidum TaxID=2922273 RepID=UPI001F13DD0A|nr:Sec-dependent nitrous-oxide reductase [Cognataquiflexum rubidum]MCH6232884.1 Sec-dependent nitrous-oxide reductase [Cognataquiflexum rubidum]